MEEGEGFQKRLSRRDVLRWIPFIPSAIYLLMTGCGEKLTPEERVFIDSELKKSGLNIGDKVRFEGRGVYGYGERERQQYWGPGNGEGILKAFKLTHVLKKEGQGEVPVVFARVKIDERFIELDKKDQNASWHTLDTLKKVETSKVG